MIDVGQQIQVGMIGFNDGCQLLEITVQLDVSLHVARHLRIIHLLR